MTVTEPPVPVPAELLERAVALDRADPLAGFPGRFADDGRGLIYLDGNSLGRLPLATVERLVGR